MEIIKCPFRPLSNVNCPVKCEGHELVKQMLEETGTDVMTNALIEQVGKPESLHPLDRIIIEAEHLSLMEPAYIELCLEYQNGKVKRALSDDQT